MYDRETMKLLRRGVSIILLAFFILVIKNNVYGQASVVTGSVSTSTTNYSPGAGNNRLLVVSVANERNNGVRSITSITWGGQNLVRAVFINNGGSGNNDLRAEVWYLNEAGINAASGLCNNFVVTWSGSITAETFAVVTLQDIDQATPVAATGTGAPAASGTSATTANMAAGTNDIVFYNASTRADATHSSTYAELTDQTDGSTMGMATATKQITTAGTEAPTATWTGSDQNVIAGVVFNGVTATGGTTYYSRNATSGGNWNDNNSWTTNADGSGGPLAAGTWPRRHDHVVIRAGHTITIDAINDNKSCGISPDGLGRSNVGPFTSSNTAMFFHMGDISISGTLSVSGIEMMVEGYTHILSAGTFSLSSNLVNLGYLQADASATLSSLDDLVLAGNSSTIINTNSTLTDDMIISFPDATLCGTGVTTLQNGSGSTITYVNGASVSQICSTFTVGCTGGGCAGTFPVTGTSSPLGSTGPGGVGNTVGTSSLVVWLQGDRGVATTTGQVTSWADQSGRNNHATPPAAGNRPAFNASALNAQPTLTFDGTDDHLSIADHASLDLTRWSFFLVAKATVHKNYNAFFVKGNDGSENFEFLSNFPGTGDIHFPILFTSGVRTTDGETGASMSNTTFGLFQYDYNQVNLTLYKNANQIFNRAETRTPTVNGLPLLIGNEAGVAGRNLNGDMAEYFAFNSTVSSAQQIIVFNYLSAKYNIALGANDFYTMDDPGNGNFDFDVAGIGQANNGTRHSDARGTGIVRMTAYGGGLQSDEFLFWGHNNASLTSNFADIDNTIIVERLNRVWSVSEVGDVPVAVAFDISGLPGSAVGSNLRLLIDRDGDGFADNDVTPISGGTLSGGVVTFTGVNFQNGDRFTLGNTNLNFPLPIELISFSAEVRNRMVNLFWTTETETNNDYFTVERLKPGNEWEPVVQMEGAGTTTSRKNYSAVDDGPYTGVSYYRLKQTDFDGTSSYSGIISVTVQPEESLEVFPNPSSGLFTVRAQFEFNTVRLTDLLGRPARVNIREMISSNEAEIDSRENIPGVYILQVSDGHVMQSVRVLIR